MKKKVVIIGAGPAGLTAGYELLKRSKDYHVTILEATNSIGGISKTVNYKGNRMDIGGHRFFSKDQKVNDFWQEILPLQGRPSFDDKKLHRRKTLDPNGPNPDKEDKVMLVRHRVSRIYYLKKFFDYPVSMKLETIKNLGVVRTISSGFSYLKTYIYKRKEDSLENFYINRFGKKLYSMFFEKYTEKIWGRHPKEISADWGSQRVKGLSITAVLKDTFSRVFHLKNKKKEISLIEEYKYPKFGPGELWEEVAHKIEEMGGEILLNYEVTKIDNKDKQIKSITCLNNGQEKKIEGDIFISSMPLKDLINDMHNVPKKIKNIGNGLPYRDFVTIGLLVRKINLKNETKIKTLNNIIPDCWLYIQESDVKIGRIQIFNNWSPYMVKKPEETIMLGLEYFCNEGDEFWNMTDKEKINFAAKELIKMKIIDKEDVLDAHVEMIKKAYPAYFDTYKDIDKLISYLDNFNNLYCVGRNGQHRYNNMDHSMITSFKTVDHIINDIEDKNEIWNVNTETDYHEVISEEKDNLLVNCYHKLKKYFDNNPLSKMETIIISLLSILLLCYVGFHLDNDSWFLLNHGKYVIEHGFPTIEPFTMHEGLNFIMQQWLFAVIYYLLYNKFAGYGITAFIIIIDFLIMYFFYRLCELISNNKTISALLTLLMNSLLVNFLFITTRPQMLTYLILILLIYFIEKYFKTGKKRYLISLPILSLLEINIHASMWWFLIIFTIPYIIEGFIDKIYFKKQLNYNMNYFIIALCIMFAVGFINPYGAAAISYFFLSTHPLAQILIAEMNVVNVLSSRGITIIIIFFINILLYMNCYKKNNYFRTSHFLMLFGCLLLALSSHKGICYILIFGIYGISSFFPSPIKKQTILPKQKWRLIFSSISLILIVTGIIYFGKERFHIDKLDENIKEPLDYLEENYNISDIKLFTDFDVGAEAEYRGIKTYIDTRAEVFYMTLNQKERIFDEYYHLYYNFYSNKEIDDIFAKRDFTHLIIIKGDSLYLHDGFTNYDLVKERSWYKLYVRKDINIEKETIEE